MPRHTERQDTQAVRTDPRINTLIHSAFDALSRRRFLVGTAVAGVGLYFLGKRIDPGFFDNPVQATQEVIDVSNRLNTFLNSAPNPTKLIEQAYRHNEGFYFPRSDIGKISLSLFGDSMNLLNGTREGNGAGTNQQGSWGDIARDNVNAFFDRTGETTHRWKYYNYAIPGSSTLGLTGDEEYDNNAQLTNPDARNKILNDPYT